MDDKKLKSCWVVLTDCLKSGPVGPGNRVIEPLHVKQHEESDACHDVLEMPALKPVEEDELASDSSVMPMLMPMIAGKHISKLKKPPSLLKHRKRGQGTAGFAKDHLLQKYGTSLLRKPSFCFEVTQTSCREITDNRVLSQLTLGGKPDSEEKRSDIKPLQNAKRRSASAAELKVQSEDSTPRSQCVHDSYSCDKICRSTKDRTKTPICDRQKQVTLTSKRGSVSQHVSDTPASGSEVILDNNQCYTNPSCEMPAVGLSVDVGLGRRLKPLQSRCVLSCLDDCKTSISPQYAEFCTSVVKSSKNPVQTVVIPIRDEHILDLMRIKWNSKSVVRKFALPSALSSNVDAPEGVPVPPSACRVGSNAEHQANVSTSVLPNSSTDSLLSSDQGQYHDRRPNPPKPKGRRRKQTFASRCGKVVVAVPEASSEVVGAGEEESEISIQAPCARKRAKLTLLGDHKEKHSQDASIEAERRQSVESVTSSVKVINPVEGDGLSAQGTFNKKQPKTQADNQPSYDPDDIRGIEGSEEVVHKPVEVIRHKAPHVVHELRRLNVAVFDVTNCLEPVACKFPDICRLGCVCGSLASTVVRENCGLEDCMFECSCTTPLASRRESYTWVQNKARENLAKEERHFKQAVVRSDNQSLILVEGRRKRNIKVPERYREHFVSDVELQSVRQFGAKDSKDLEPKQPKAPRKKSLLPSCTESSDVTPESSLLESETEDLSSEDEPLESQNTGVSARTKSFVYVRSVGSKDEQKQLLSVSACEKIKIRNELTIVSAESLDMHELEEPQINSTLKSDQDTCMFLFDHDFINKKKDEVVLLPWSALRQDLQKGVLCLWIKTLKYRPKVFLTKSNEEPPCDGCVDLLSIKTSSDVYNDLPFHLKNLRLEQTISGDHHKCVWIAKRLLEPKYVRKDHWMIVGYLQPGQTICETKEVDVLPSFDEEFEYRWWVMDISQDFDMIYFIDFKKAMTKQQITTLVRLSNEDSEEGEKIHRILLNRQRPKIDPRPTPFPDFGAYSIANHPSKVFIGPYKYSREPRFHVYSQKVAHNGRTEYERIPLFYCGGGESVRVNSRGVLSLHSECPPKKYVKGAWYQSCGKEFRETSKQLVQAISIDDSEDEGKPPSVVDLVEDDSPPCDKQAHTMSPSKEISVVASRTLINPMRRRTRRRGISLLKNSVSQAPAGHLGEQSKVEHCVDEPKSEEKKSDVPQHNLEYLVPSEKGIGVLTLTHLPSGVISVPHFSDASLLKFYHHKEEIIKDINLLIHHKLSCCSRKCKLILKPKEACTCVAWVSYKNKDKLSVPEFTPDLFNGFFMLTRFGLVDVRSADKEVISALGRDWVEWLKNDEIRCKLNAWRKEEIEVSEKHYDLMRVITSSQKADMSLLQVLAVATDEIAKLKAEDQLLDLENQTQMLLKETLVSSLCRKLNGVPGEVVPQLLQQMDLSLLWDVLECMDSRNTTLLPDEATQYKLPGVDSDGIKVAMQKKKVNMKIQRSLIKPDESKKPPLSTLNETSSQSNKDGISCQVSPFARLNICVEEGGIKCGPGASTSCISADKTEKISSPKKKELQLSPGKPPNILMRKNKPTHTLLAENTSPVGNHSQKQARKQLLFLNPDDEVPIFEGDPTFSEPAYTSSHQNSDDENQNSGSMQRPPSVVPVSKQNEEDPLSAVQISSVVSDVAWDDDLPNSPTLKSDSSKSLIPSQNLTRRALNIPSARVTDPISSLKISSVYSAKTMPSNFPQVEGISSGSASDSDPISSLRISSVVSGAIPAGFHGSSASTHDVSSVQSSLPINRNLARNTIQGLNMDKVKTSRGFVIPPSLSQGIQSKNIPLSISKPMKNTSMYVTSKNLTSASNESHQKSGVFKTFLSKTVPIGDPKGVIPVLKKTSNGFSLSVPGSSIKIIPPPVNKPPIIPMNKTPIIVSVTSNASNAILPSSMLNGVASISRDIRIVDNQEPVINEDGE